MQIRTRTNTNMINILLFLIIMLFSFVNTMKMRSQIESLSDITEKPITDILPNLQKSLENKQLNFMNLIQAQLKEIHYPTPQEHITSFYDLLFNTKDNITSSYKDSFPFCNETIKEVTENCKEEKNTTYSKIAYYSLYMDFLGQEIKEYSNAKATLDVMKLDNAQINQLKVVLSEIDSHDLYMNIAKELYSKYEVSDTLNIFGAVQVNSTQISNSTSSSNQIEKDEIVNQTKYIDGEFQLNRNAHGQMLFDKVSSYLKGSSKRREELYKEKENLLSRIVEADENTQNVIKEIEDLIEAKKDRNTTLKGELKTEVDSKYTCEGIYELKGRCDEISKIYENAMTIITKQNKYYDEFNQILVS